VVEVVDGDVKLGRIVFRVVAATPACYEGLNATLVIVYKEGSQVWNVVCIPIIVVWIECEGIGDSRSGAGYIIPALMSSRVVSLKLTCSKPHWTSPHVHQGRKSIFEFEHVDLVRGNKKSLLLEADLLIYPFRLHIFVPLRFSFNLLAWTQPALDESS